jgi:hypothetical protein
MYIFSATGVAKKPLEDVEIGQSVPFIVYINFKDLFGARKLCQIYLMNAGFGDIKIENMKEVSPTLLQDVRVLAADKALSDAVQHGYHVQMFDEP